MKYDLISLRRSRPQSLRGLWFIGLLASAMGSAGCQAFVPCGNDLIYNAVTVFVTDASTGKGIAPGATAIITFRADTESHTFPMTAADGDGYASRFDKAGTFNIRVSKAGYADWNQSVSVSGDRCGHAIGVNIRAMLTPVQ